jgi:hypothetical protein
VTEIKRTMKERLPARWQSYARRGGRLRWITKARNLRQEGDGAWRGKPLRQARYVLFDPEVDSYTYALANTDELAERLAEVLERPVEEIDAHLEEGLGDPELGAGLARDVGWRALFVKRRPPLPSHHLSAWVIIRLRKPTLVVETGILHGLGSRTILRALELNRAEGAAGELISFDIAAGAGDLLVTPRLRAAWTPVYEPTPRALAPHLRGRQVDLFIHDSVQDHDHLRAEVEAVLPFAAPAAILMTVAGWSGVFAELSAGLEAQSWTFHERPADHFYRGRTIGWLRLAPRPDAKTAGRARDAAPGPVA